MSFASNIAHYLIGRQTDKSTPATAYRKVRSAGDPSLMPNREMARLEETDSSRDRSDAYVARIGVEGDLPIYVRPEIVSDLFYGVLGARASAAGTDTITPSDDLPWWTIHRMFGNVVHESFIGCKMLSLGLESAAGGALVATLGIAGISASWIDPEPTSADVDDEPFFHHDLDGRLELGGQVRRPSRFSLTISNGGGGYQADRITYEDVDVGQRALDASWTERFNDVAEYRETYYGNAAGVALSPTLTRETLDLRWQKGGGAPFLDLAFPKVLRAGYPIQPSPGGDPVEVEVAVEVEKATASPILTVTCTTPPAIP